MAELLIRPHRKRLQLWMEQQRDRERQSEALRNGWLDSFRRGVVQESVAALLLARQIGLDLPCDRSTS